MVRGDPRYTKRSRHCLLYILSPSLAFSLDCCSILLLLCAVTGHASLNIISDRHDHHHHQLLLSIYQHSRVPGEWGLLLLLSAHHYLHTSIVFMSCVFVCLCACTTRRKPPYFLLPCDSIPRFHNFYRRENADGEMFRHWKNFT
ncbi:hypothetical protein BO86DRAFT_238617 [Aspergillus japonicus CBS 114.51]|uniref:Uncharacterized protein n=1 Tax=Aspergillus japonicus CBS 114.51 TaxID=1448312 RepID=A0A8T8WM67_ASPJA|nr:hypothetical protein BO86DRAFT_238617 [Aspergillus japonicus CBS 114.51]RAH76803.1 hypothetical protein BO86DRAFT_238617 [Aspergillus japonicus CBS 114.51]